MKEIISELSKLGKEIDQAKTNVSQLEGRKVEVVKRLQEEFGVSTVEECEALLEKMNKQLSELSAEIEKDFETLKKDFQW